MIVQSTSGRDQKPENHIHKVGRFFAMVISSELLHANHPLRPRVNHHREEAPDFIKIIKYDFN